MKILGIPGSLRTNSSSNQVLGLIPLHLPPSIEFIIYERLKNIPAFDDSETIPESVIHFKNSIIKADAILICTPEYAFGIPGALKNAIDWTVSSGELVGKPLGLITASSQGEKGHAAFLDVLSALSTQTPPEATLLISFIRSKLNEKGEIKDPELMKKITSVLDSLIACVN
ncbi:NAD(P)H-dependent oxidoreductase [Solitalea sp. MAHUQ-68]|uniref:NAD(P)H-dependent oxidoreductase n=1 Tax=Solitalea agri TaxID=2953739 RepID=A0A9X2F8M0_9SPHI|nr:NAD(P)H-dependent oxidoreductase [Solitalea agri]MCO4293748.1 NAD(P)H-dependent oxidoreductase [Solitalea agri]